MAKLKITKNIPIPAKGDYKYPFNEMEIGDSILFDRADCGRVRASANYHFRKNKWVYTVRSDGDKSRLWRVE